jgi:hypothetical protein
MFMLPACPMTEHKPGMYVFAVKKHSFLFWKKKQGSLAIILESPNFYNRVDILFGDT